METTELLKKVRKLEIKTRGISNHIFSGEYHSAFKGRGMSFSEVREYQYGDDVRNIDWNVTARFNHPYVKVFEEERELVVMLLIDISASSLFGTRNQTKKSLITELSAILSFSAINNNDKVGVIFFSDTIEKFIPPKKGRMHILRIIRELLDIEPKQKGTNISAALDYFNNMIKKRSILFILSDFMNTGYKDALKIASRKHDVVGLRIFDMHEEELPDIGMVRIYDAEQGQELWLNTSSGKVQRDYKLNFMKHAKYFKETFSTSGADFTSIRTDGHHINELLRLFRKRERMK